MRRMVAVAMALLLFPSVGAAWTTYQGDAARSGVVDIGEGPFDVVSTFEIGQTIPGSHLANLLNTPHGLIGMNMETPEGSQQNERECNLFRLTALDGSALDALPTVWPCAFTESATTGLEASNPIAAGYSPLHDLVLACVPSTLPASVLYAIDPVDGTEAWDIGPPWLDGDLDGTGMAGVWSCNGAAIDDETGEAIVLFQAADGGSHRLASIRLENGAANWVTSIAPLSLNGDHEDSDNVLAENGHGVSKSPYWAFGSVFGVPAVVDTGIVVPVFMSNLATLTARYQQNSAVWLDREGTIQGKTWNIDGDYVQEAEGGGTTAFAPAGWEDHVAVLVDNTVHIIQPEVGTSVPIPTNHNLGAARWTVSPCWYEDWLFVSLEAHALILDPNGIREPVDWPGLDAGELQQCLMTANVEAYVIISRLRSEEDLHDLLKVDLRTGKTIAQTPLPLQGRATWVDDHLMPIDVDGQPGLLAWDQFGHFAVLGEADEALRPVLTVQDDHPPVGLPVVLDVDSPPTASYQVVAWGDGVTSNLENGEQGTHEYDGAGTFTIHVTTVFDDGRTASASIPIHYGQQDLNWLQTQFAAENQDRTWGVIGVILVLFGAIIALVTRRIGRGRIAAGLRELAAIRSHAKDDQLAALRELQQWHGIQEDRLLRGRLTEDQFRVLEGRGARVLRSVAGQVVRPVAESLPRSLQAALEAAYRDGFVDSSEVADLREQLNGTRLAAGKRKVVSRLLDAWA